MSKKKMTPWFDGDVKPVRVGVYERDDSKTEVSDGTESYSYWSGFNWKTLCTSVRVAEASNYYSEFQSLPWRGLASRPR